MQEKLILLKEEHHLTNEKMGEILGISAKQYRKKEQGLAPFKMNEMFVLSEYLNKIIEDIFLTPTHQNGAKGTSELITELNNLISRNDEE